jgi:outer membrane protein insertion porin family
VDEGDPFSELLVAKSINRIKGRNIFSKVDFKEVAGSTEDVKILEINVEEKATGEIMAGAGVGTEGASFMFSVKENNWVGKGLSLTSALSISKERVSGNFSLTDPNYRFSGNSVSTTLNVSATDRADTTGYKSSKTGFSLGTSFEQWENIFFSPTIGISHEDIEADATASNSIKKMDGTYFNSDFTYGITLDKRNQRWQPTEGYITSFFQSLPIIQDSSSVMNTYSASIWNEFSENAIGSLKFQAKTVHGVDDDVRLTNRLYVDGRKLRGFVRGKVGPKDGVDWIGGNYVAGLSAEVQLPNLLPESYKTDFSVYLDTANIWGVDYSDTIGDSSKIRSSIGISANVFTPVGPLSWTLSQSISKASTDQTETFNFNIGTSF